MLWRMIEGQAVQRMKERNIYAPLTTYARTADKQVVARAIQGRASQGMLSLPEQAPWLADLEAELLRFPAAKHDDWVDCLALVGLHLDKVVAPPAMDMRPGTARTDYNLWDTSGAKRPHRERLTWPLN